MSASSRLIGVACLAVAGAAVPAAMPNPPALELVAHVLDAGSRESLRSACWHIVASIGEASVGHAWSADYALSSGFQTGAAPLAADDVFFDGFEVCTP